MFPYHYTYDIPAYSSPRAYGRDESQYLQALAEEEAARRQYQQALREQEYARNRAARARLARQVYESPSYDSYLDDDYGYGSSPHFGRPSFPSYADPSYLSPQEQRALFQDRQRRIDAIEREREKERQRIHILEEKEKQRVLEEERRRRRMLEEEERQRREDEECLRRQHRFPTFSPLDELLGLRPSRFGQPEMSNTRRARTLSPGQRSFVSQPAQSRPQPQRGTPARERSSCRSPGVDHIPINSSKSTPSQPTRAPSLRHYTASEATAAEKIQSVWRTHHRRRTALASIASLASKFEAIKSAFILPSALDYTYNGEVVTVPTSGWDASSSLQVEVEKSGEDASLAYTPTNVPLHAYEEELSRILTALDGVQSGGEREVRNRRRELVRKVEREAERIEKLKILVWRAWVTRQHETQKATNEQADSLQLSNSDVGEEQPMHPAEKMQLDPPLMSSPADGVSFVASRASVEEDIAVETFSPTPADDHPIDPEPPCPSEPLRTVTRDNDPVPTEEMQVEDDKLAKSDAVTLVKNGQPDIIPVIAEEHNVGIDRPPSAEILEVELAEDVERPTEVAVPDLAYSASEAEDSTPLNTPPVMHVELQGSEEKNMECTTTPMTAEKSQMLRPLVSQEWDEEMDFF